MENAGRIRDAVDAIKGAEANNLHVYSVYADITEHFGLRRLLLSVVEQIEDHLEEWKSLVGTHFPEELFDVDEGRLTQIRALEIPRMFDADMAYHDFLQMLLRRERAIAAMYRILAAAAVHSESKALCARLESNSVRTMEMARDRYELEVLMDEMA